MAVAGGVGHTRCPHCRCWLPTSESWNLPLGILALLALLAWVTVQVVRAHG